MLLPFHRGYQTWSQRLQAVEFAHKIEMLQDSRPDYAYIENGLHLPLSADLYTFIASSTYLEKHFGYRYLAGENCVQFSFRALYEQCQKDNAKSVNDLGAEFDFSLSLHFDHFFLQRESLSQSLRNSEKQQLSVDTRKWLDAGFNHHLNYNYKEALRCFREAIQVEPSLYTILYRIGLIYFNSSEGTNEASALHYFKHCAEVALLKNDTHMAALAYLHAAFTTYLLTKDNEAIQLVQNAISLDSSLAECYYLYAKIASHDTTTGMMMLQTAVMLDPYYAIKVCADNDLEPIQNELFRTLQKQARERAQIRLLELEKERSLTQTVERSIKESEITVGHVGAHRPLFERIKLQYDQLSEIYNRNTFFDLREFTERCDRNVLNGKSSNFSVAIRNRFAKLQELSKGYKAIEKEGDAFAMYRQAVKFCSWLVINLASATSLLMMKHYFHLSADWLVFIPVFFGISVLVPYADLLFDRLDRFLFYFKIDWLRSRRESDIRSRIEAYMHDRYLMMYSLINIAFLISGIVMWLMAGLVNPPLLLFIWNVILYLVLKSYEKYRDLTNDRLEKKRQLDDQINLLITSELK
jgi:hypothetical protein